MRDPCSTKVSNDEAVEARGAAVSAGDAATRRSGEIVKLWTRKPTDREVRAGVLVVPISDFDPVTIQKLKNRV
jgi:hypothetical protein